MSKINYCLFFSISEPECRIDPNCHTTKYCELTNGTCADPCIRDPCGPNAIGTPINHRCQCRCIEGYTGNPVVGCSKFSKKMNKETQTHFVIFLL